MSRTTDPDSILRTLRQIVRRMSEHSRRLSKESGLTVPQVLGLRAVAELGESATVVGVGRAVQMSPPTVSGVMDRLEARGFVRRERGTDDRRRVYLRLTEAGANKVSALPTPLHAAFVDRLQAMGDDERSRIGDVLDSIATMMGTDPAAGPDLAPSDLI